MIILGIETSCDETAASVVADGRKILSHIIATSLEIHASTGGIIPENAAREQVKFVIPVIEQALEVSSVNKDQIDSIAVTVGPGLIGSLLVGVETAKTLAALWEKPIIPVNHLVAHIYANWLSETTNNKAVENKPEPKLPAIALVVSGGHTDLVLLKKHGDMQKIGGTRDDAAGEAFDKTARLLGFSLVNGFGGPAIARSAESFKQSGQKSSIKFPRPMMHEDNYDFSFSGLKTAVQRDFAKFKDISQDEFSFEIQEAIVDVLVTKTLKAVKQFDTPTLLLAGGVAANSRLREKFRDQIENEDLDLDFRVAPPWLCTDNASYIAACAEYNYNPKPWQEIEANPSLTIIQ